MAKTNFLKRIFGKKEDGCVCKKESTNSGLCSALPREVEKKRKVIPGSNSKIEYRRAYDRLNYAKRHGKISITKFAKDLKALKAQYGMV